ncbi:hypothetical protein KC686_00465, partial [Candidatus Woesebacteria bacterium]|nr:hypothetical protein [Candidatus Woesebacteria bacterium]
KMKAKIVQERKSLQKQLSISSDFHEAWLDNFEKAFNFTKNARHKLKHGTLEEKRIIVSTLGLNLTIDTKKVKIDLKKEYQALKTGKEVAEKIEKVIEPEVLTVESIQNAYDSGQFPIMGSVRESVRTLFSLYFPIKKMPLRRGANTSSRRFTP